MRNKVLKIITWLFSFFLKRTIISNSVFLLNTISIGKNCNVKIRNAYVSHLKIRLKGDDNKLIIEGGYYRRGEIKIIGKNNVIEIGKNGNLSNLTIIVHGNNCHVDIGNEVTSGSGFIACMGENNYVIIGNDCMLAEYVDIWATDSHGIYDIKETTLLNTSAPIIIGNHVWLGKWASVLKGVTIGDGAIIGMKSLVVKDISPYTINVGSPTRIIKEEVCWKREFINK